MKVLYVRVSTLDQKTDRQKNESKEFDLVVEDKCSGAIPLFQREGGKKILTMIEKGMVTSISVHSIDRCGRDLLDILSVIKFMNEHLIPMFFIQQGLRTIDEKGKENAISKMMISILGTVAEMERSRIRENQKEGIELAKLRGIYKGRKKGAKADIQKWIQKPKIAKTIEYLKKGYKANEISKIVGIHVNTITKVKKVTSHQ
jgi:DNA invertase Pin-like site-specific DNA recombinase